MNKGFLALFTFSTVKLGIEYDDLEIINKNTVDFNSFSYYYSNCTGEKINKKDKILAFLPEQKRYDEFHPEKIRNGSLTLAHSRNSQMSFMYGFFFVKFLFFYCCMCCNCDIIVVKDGCFYETVL